MNGSRKSLTDSVKANLTIPGRFTVEEYNQLKIQKGKLEYLNDYELCWFIMALENYDPTLYRAAAYFTDVEITAAKIHTRSKQNISNYLTLEYCGTMAQGQHLCMATVEQIGKLKEYGYLHVIPEVQRESNIVRIGDEVIRNIRVNYKRVDEIAELISSNQYYYNDIRFNLLKDDENELIIDSEKNKVLLPENGILIIPDGNHRSIACEVAIEKYKEIKDSFCMNKFPILLTNFPVTIVKKIVAQEWNREPVSKTHMASMQSTNANKIIDSIVLKADDEADARYASNIVTTRVEIKSGNGIILKDLLAESISKIYNTETQEYNSPIKRNGLVSWLIEFFNQVVYILPEFKDVKKARSDSWAIAPEAWCGYVYLSKRLRDRKDWVDSLSKILGKIDFRKENVPTLSKTTNRIIRDMSDFFGRMDL